MKTTKTKPMYLPASECIAVCENCKKKYICFSNMEEHPTCPYCNIQQEDRSVSLLEFNREDIKK